MDVKVYVCTMGFKVRRPPLVEELRRLKHFDSPFDVCVERGTISLEELRSVLSSELLDSLTRRGEAIVFDESLAAIIAEMVGAEAVNAYVVLRKA